MVSCEGMLKSVLVLIVLVVLTKSGSAALRVPLCCTKVSTKEITDPIVGYLIQSKRTHPCVSAVIFQTDKGLFCSYRRAPWVARKIRAFEKEKSKSTTLSPVSPSGVSLLSIITSTASPSSSFTSSRPVFPAFEKTKRQTTLALSPSSP